MTVQLTDLLRPSKPEHAFALFTVAVGAGVALVVSDWLKPWSPSIPVALYGLALYGAQKQHYVHHGPTVRDSPYFLGFILTLVALLRVLSEFGAPAAGARPRLESFVVEIGAAILTTIVGLFFRQFLLSTDPLEAAQDKALQSFADRLRKQSGALLQAQADFAALASEFAKAHEHIWHDEEAAYKKYITGLQKGAETLSIVAQEYPAKLRDLHATVANSAERFGNGIDSATLALAKLRSELEAAIRGQSTDLAAAMNSLAHSFGGETRELTAIMRATSQDLQREGPALVSVLGSLRQDLSAVGGELAGLRQTAQMAAVEVGKLPTTVADAAMALRAHTDDSAAAITTRAAAFAKELEQIDRIVEDLVRLLKHRIDQLGRVG